MDFKIIKNERKFAGYEFQLKIKADIDEEDVRKLGAKKLGNVLHEDKYFIFKGKQINETNELIRIRKEGGEDILFTYKGPIANKKIRNRLVINKPIQEKDISDIKKKYNEVVSVNKKRTIFLLDSVVINLDKIENLGNFIEFEVEKEKDYDRIISLVKKLDLDPQNLTKLSYFELALMNLSLTQRILVKIHEKFGRFSFGISSAVLTTLGIIVGLNSATSSILAVIGGIIAVAIADSLSDSVGMYASKKSERGTSPASAFKSALNVFSGKIVFTLTFIIPFLILPFTSAIYGCIIWGLILLTFVNIQIAFVQEESIFKTIVKNILIAIVVIVASYLAGKGVVLITNLS